MSQRCQSLHRCLISASGNVAADELLLEYFVHEEIVFSLLFSVCHAKNVRLTFSVRSGRSSFLQEHDLFERDT